MSPSDADSPVLIIGGGAAGLSAAATLARRRIHATVLEQDDFIGSSWVRRYQSLKLHTIRRFSGLAHYPIPKDRPQYLSKDEYAAYLTEYVKVLGLDVSLGEAVNLVQAVSPSDEGKDWEVVSNHGIRKAKVVIIATGHYAKARLPTWEGLDEFTGKVLHSSQYITGANHKQQKALVVGLGNSAAEIATDLITQGAASVSVSVRTSPPIVTREMFKVIPVQLFGIAFMNIGMPGLLDRIAAALRRFSVGDLKQYGIGEAAWGPFTARKPAVIDTAGFVNLLKQGHIKVRPGIEHFNSNEVVYTDGSREDVDVVIAATGFRTGLEKFLKVPGVIDENGQPLFQLGKSTSAPGLYFIGFDETIRGHLFEINRESKQLAAEVDHYLTQSNGLPPVS